MRKHYGIILLIVVAISSTTIVWLLGIIHQNNLEIIKLKALTEKEPVMVSEYQEALYQFIKKNPQAANEFIELIEKENTTSK